jgi:diguanylate cyclase
MSLEPRPFTLSPDSFESSGSVQLKSRESANSATVLCVTTNFMALRRQLGVRGWLAAIDHLTVSMISAMPGARGIRIAPDCIQLETSASSVSDLRQRIDDALIKCEMQFSADNVGATLGLVVGAAIAFAECDTLTLQEQAETALAKACRGQRVVVAEVGEQAQGLEEIAILRDLPTASENGEFFLLYQPKINVREQTVTSAEALIRWLHPVVGLIMPDAFIGAADESGDILPIAIWTLRQIIADQQMLRMQGHHLRLFMNVSGRLLTDETFINTACDLVQTSGAEIGFEITETSVIHDPDLAISNLERCAAIGINLAIDDYGSGLSSLAYLKRLPARELKIDKQFITQLTSSHRDPLIVRSTIDLAHALDMQVTAEGVETPAALALLTVMGCEMVQGYLISPPLAFPSFTRYLEDYRFEALQADTLPTVVRPASFWKRG